MGHKTIALTTELREPLPTVPSTGQSLGAWTAVFAVSDYYTMRLAIWLYGHLLHVPIPSVIRSYTFRTTSPLSCFPHNVLRSYTFLIRSYTPRLVFATKLSGGYTFRATPLAIHATCDTKLYVPIRAEYILTTFLQVNFKYVSRSYTFLYVPRHPSRNSRNL